MSGRRDRQDYDSGSSSYRSSRHHDGGRHGRHSSHHDGDWICSGCGNNNFARRRQCNKCGQEKSHAKTKSGGIEIGKQLAEKSKGLFAADDWQCKMCGNVNWSRRSECNVCKSPKVGCVESRTGYGGGFNERENVQYNEREDSDGEFDEFGRKKKKYRGKLDDERKERETKNETNKKEKEDEEDEEDDEEDGDSDAYKLTSDEEEEEDENDVSAYDLGDSDEDTNDKKDPNSSAAKSSENSESAGHDGQRKRARSRSRSHEREIKKFAES